MQLGCRVMVAERDWRWVIALGMLLGGVALAGASAHASVIGYASSGGTHDPNQGFTMGVRFDTNQSIMIDSLGVLDVGSNGLGASHDVGLWDASGNLLRSATVLAGTESTLQDGFRFESIAPVQLAAGETFIVAAYYGDEVISGDKLYETTPTAHPAISLNSVTMFAKGGSLEFPDQISFDFRSTAGFTFVPEPTTALLLMAGLAGLALRGRSRA
jgi:hypothetical protein